MDTSPVNHFGTVRLNNKQSGWMLNKIDILFWGLIFLLFCYLCQKGAVLQPDSSGYIQNGIIRSPIYPIVLKIFTQFLGDNNFKVLICMQILMGFLAVVFTTLKFKQLTEEFISFPKVLFYLMILVLLFPYYGPMSFGNNILTEALCYPLFLMIFSYLMNGLRQKNTRSLMMAIILSGILVLTRGQFLFLYPAIGILLFYIWIFERKFFKTLALILCLFLTIISANLLERSYQYIYHGQFKPVPFTGIQLITAPLYLAKESDIHLLKNDTEKALFKDIWTVMEQKKINFNSLHETSYFHMETYTHFYHSYNPICWESLSPLLAKYGFSSPYQIDTFLTKMALTLIVNNLKAFFTLYLLNIVLNIGGIYFVLLLISATLCALMLSYKTRHPLSLVYLLVTLLNAGNYLLIALVEPILRRYSTYTDVLQVTILLIMITIGFQSMQNRSKRLQNLKRL